MGINLHRTRRPESVRGEVGADGVAAGIFNTYIITIVVHITRAGSACARVNESLLRAFERLRDVEITIFEFRAAHTHILYGLIDLIRPPIVFFFPIIFAKNVPLIYRLFGGPINAKHNTRSVRWLLQRFFGKYEEVQTIISKHVDVGRLLVLRSDAILGDIGGRDTDVKFRKQSS